MKGVSAKEREAFDLAMRRIDALVGRLEAEPTSFATTAARELLAAVLEVHHIGLSAMVTELAAHAPAAAAALLAAADEPIVSTLLSLHGLGEGTSTEPADGPAAALVTLRTSRDGEAVAQREADTTASAASTVSADGARCDLCAAPIGATHAHLHDEERRLIRCTCAACAALMTSVAGNLHRVTPFVRALDPFVLADDGLDAQDALGIPVGLAYFRVDRDGAVHAAYPSVAGTALGTVAPDAWARVVRDNPTVGTLAPDVAALLVNRLGGRRDAYLVSVDRCYELSHVVARAGREPGDALARFFDQLAVETSQPGPS